MKIIGIGTDIVKINRMESFLKKRSLLEKTFTKKEIQYATKHKNPLIFLASHFAAKEAILKILKTESILSIKKIEIIHDENGAPNVKFCNSLKDIIKKKKINNWLISLSHEKKYAIAFVIGVDK